MIFLHIFLSILINIGSFFIYCKNTNPILKYLVFVKKKCFFWFRAYALVSQSLKKKSYCIFIQQRKFQTIYFGMHFGFSNQFIKVTRTWSIFQKKFKKKYFFVLMFRITNLYIKRIPDIKKVVLLQTLEGQVLPDKIRTSSPRRTFLKPQIDQHLEIQ